MKLVVANPVETTRLERIPTRPSMRGGDWQWKVLWSVATVGFLLSFPSSLSAQPPTSPGIAFDASFGEAGREIPQIEDADGLTFEIEAEEGRRFGHSDQNLLHSFERFNLAERETALFLAPEGSVLGDVDHLIARVTGESLSTIAGNISLAEGLDGASFYLLNPNGVMFNGSAEVDLNGSFYAGAVGGVRFGGELGPDLPVEETTGDWGGWPDLESAGDPSHFLLSEPDGPDPGGDLIFDGEFLTRPDLSGGGAWLGNFTAVGRSITVSGDGSFIRAGAPPNSADPSVTTSSLSTIRLASLGRASGVVPLEIENLDLGQLDLATDESAQVRLESGTELSTNLASLGRGRVVIRGGKLVLERGAKIVAAGMNPDENAVAIDIEVAGLVSIGETGDDGTTAEILAAFPGAGTDFDLGETRIRADEVSVEHGVIKSTSAREVLAGDIIIEARSVSLDGNVGASEIVVESRLSAGGPGSSGPSRGNILIGTEERPASRVSLRAGAEIRTDVRTLTDGVKAGNIVIRSAELSLDDRSHVVSTHVPVGAGGGGGSGKIEVWGREVSVLGLSQISTSTGTSDDAGSIDLDLGNDGVVLISGSSLTTVETNEGPRVIVEFSALAARSGPDADAAGDYGDGGDIEITTGDLRILDGAKITTAALPDGSGNAGDITVTATRLVQLEGAETRRISELSTESKSRSSGKITVDVSEGALQIGANSRIAADIFGEVAAGEIILTADSIQVIGENARVGTVSTLADNPNAGRSGTIRLKATGGDLEISSGGKVSSTSGAGGSSSIELEASVGSVFIRDGDVVADSESTEATGNIAIVAGEAVWIDDQGAIVTRVDAVEGAGGDIDVTAPVIAIGNARLIADAPTPGQSSAGDIVLTGTTAVFRSSEAILEVGASQEINSGRVVIESPETVVVAEATVEAEELGDASDELGEACLARKTAMGSFYLDSDSRAVPTPEDSISSQASPSLEGCPTR